MQWLNYHHLYYFWTIATEGGIARAAEKLRLGQPTLSAQLRTLETHLGHELFERRNRKLVLTEAGQIALNYASEIFRLGGEMMEALQDRRAANARVHVQIGALDSVPKQLALRLTEAAFKVQPCLVSILEGKGDELLRELISHRLDILLSNYPPSLGAGVHDSGRGLHAASIGESHRDKIHTRSLAKVPIVICAAPRFKSLIKKFPQSLTGQPFVLPTFHSKLRFDLDHFFRSHQIAIDPIAETQDTTLQKLLGQSGAGLIPIAEPAAAELLQDKSMVKLGRLPGVFEEFWLVSASRKIENPVAAHLMRTFSFP